MANAPGSARAHYHRFVASSLASDGVPIEDMLSFELSKEPIPEGIDALWNALLALRVQDTGTVQGIEAERILLGYAPSALIEACWLTEAVHVRHSHGELGAACLDAFHLLCGEGDAGLHRGNLYRALLASRGLLLPEVASPGFATEPRFEEADFRLALLGLGLGCREDRLPETLGFHAAITILGPPSAVIRAGGDRSSRYLDESAPGSPAGQRAMRLARRCLEAYAAQGGADWAGILRGATALVRERHSWCASLRPQTRPSALQAMIALVEAKARHAFGFHHQGTLGGRPLDSWFDPERLDAFAFLRELGRSKWVAPGRPEQSPLTTRAVSFGGPMFGAFTDDEIEVMREWIRSLPASVEEEKSSSVRADRPALALVPQPRQPEPAEPLALPQLYHHLLGRSREPRTVALARAQVVRVLAKVRRSVTPAWLARQGLWPYSAERLFKWVDARLHEQVFVGKDDEGSGLLDVISREDAVWLLTQLSPSAVVDGAWLMGATAPGRSHTPVSALLFRIYRDELGAGVSHQHHGNVMRRALSAQAVTLPPCDSPDFCAYPGFLPESFALPVLWLSIALHSAEFLPELLGLNLAIEKAGIGQTYESAITLLRRHDIDPYFFELHNTIDNNHNGHTAWSVQAIQLHMDEVAARGDAAAIDETWLRLFRGHAAYAATSAPLVRAMALNMGPRIALRWLRRRLFGTPQAAGSSS